MLEHDRKHTQLSGSAKVEYPTTPPESGSDSTPRNQSYLATVGEKTKNLFHYNENTHDRHKSTPNPTNKYATDTNYTYSVMSDPLNEQHDIGRLEQRQPEVENKKSFTDTQNTKYLTNSKPHKKERSSSVGSGGKAAEFFRRLSIGGHKKHKEGETATGTVPAGTYHDKAMSGDVKLDRRNDVKERMHASPVNHNESPRYTQTKGNSVHVKPTNEKNSNRSEHETKQEFFDAPKDLEENMDSQAHDGMGIFKQDYNSNSELSGSNHVGKPANLDGNRAESLDPARTEAEGDNTFIRDPAMEEESMNGRNAFCSYPLDPSGSFHMDSGTNTKDTMDGVRKKADFDSFPIKNDNVENFGMSASHNKYGDQTHMKHDNVDDSHTGSYEQRSSDEYDPTWSGNIMEITEKKIQNMDSTPVGLGIHNARSGKYNTAPLRHETNQMKQINRDDAEGINTGKVGSSNYSGATFHTGSNAGMPPKGIMSGSDFNHANASNTGYNTIGTNSTENGKKHESDTVVLSKENMAKKDMNTDMSDSNINRKNMMFSDSMKQENYGNYASDPSFTALKQSASEQMPRSTSEKTSMAAKSSTSPNFAARGQSNVAGASYTHNLEKKHMRQGDDFENVQRHQVTPHDQMEKTGIENRSGYNKPSEITEDKKIVDNVKDNTKKHWDDKSGEHSEKMDHHSKFESGFNKIKHIFSGKESKNMNTTENRNRDKEEEATTSGGHQMGASAAGVISQNKKATKDHPSNVDTDTNYNKAHGSEHMIVHHNDVRNHERRSQEMEGLEHGHPHHPNGENHDDVPGTSGQRRKSIIGTIKKKLENH